jgi:hypothetical protein
MNKRFGLPMVLIFAFMIVASSFHFIYSMNKYFQLSKIHKPESPDISGKILDNSKVKNGRILIEVGGVEKSYKLLKFSSIRDTQLEKLKKITQLNSVVIFRECLAQDVIYISDIQVAGQNFFPSDEAFDNLKKKKRNLIFNSAIGFLGLLATIYVIIQILQHRRNFEMYPTSQP